MGKGEREEVWETDRRGQEEGGGRERSWEVAGLGDRRGRLWEIADRGEGRREVRENPRSRRWAGGGCRCERGEGVRVGRWLKEGRREGEVLSKGRGNGHRGRGEEGGRRRRGGGSGEVADLGKGRGRSKVLGKGRGRWSSLERGGGRSQASGRGIRGGRWLRERKGEVAIAREGRREVADVGEGGQARSSA